MNGRGERLTGRTTWAPHPGDGLNRLVAAPDDFLDDSDELRLWLEMAPNLGAEYAAEVVRAELRGEG